MKSKLLLLTISIFLFSKINAQNDSTKIYSGSLVFNGLLQTGNTNKFIISGRGELKRATRKLEAIISFAASYGENKGVKDDNSYLGTFTADLFFRDMISPFILQYAEYNFSKGISFRSQSGAGLKYLFIKPVKNHTSVSAAFIYEYLNLLKVPAGANDKEYRISLRLKSRQELIKEKMIISVTAMYQPAIDVLNNYNLFIDATIEFPLNKIFRLNANYNYGFSNTVSIGRKRADNKLTFGAGIYL